MGGKLLALLTALLLAMMLFACGVFSIGFMIAGNVVSVTLGTFLGVLCLLGFWGLYHEVNFGFGAEKVRRGVYSQGGVCVDSGEGASRGHEFWIEKIKDGSDTYANWYYLAVAYDEAGNRKKAREAMREAIRCYSNATITVPSS